MSSTICLITPHGTGYAVEASVSVQQSGQAIAAVLDLNATILGRLRSFIAFHQLREQFVHHVEGFFNRQKCLIIPALPLCLLAVRPVEPAQTRDYCLELGYRSARSSYLWQVPRRLLQFLD